MTGYDGRYGSWHVGVYNGCGYTPPRPTRTRCRNTASPCGLCRTVCRVAGDLLRPVRQRQLQHQRRQVIGGAHFLNYYPDWIVNMGYLSYQNPWFILTAQVFAAKGNQAGNWTTAPNNPAGPSAPRADSLWTRGYSVFGDVKVPACSPFWGAISILCTASARIGSMPTRTRSIANMPSIPS